MKFNKDSYEDQIKSLEEKAFNLKIYLPVHRYFKAVANIHNSYMVELRRIYVKKFFALGFNNSEIARLLCKDHATISYLMKSTNEADSIRLEIIDHCESWVINGDYPVTYTETAPSCVHKHGVKSVIKYELKNIYNGEFNGQNSSTDIRPEKVA
jgi:hypothetical protein